MSTLSDMSAAGMRAEERFGVLVRITPESVAAYKQHQAAGAQAGT